jgi:N-acyl amino acid synthase of PEP-CTERM/exosortase system
MAREATPSTYFDFVRVDISDTVWLDVQRLRYDVYCDELGFLDPSLYPGKLECDAFDPVSVHFAGLDNDRQAIATLRLVPDSPLGFPLEARSGALFPEFHGLPRDKTVEISRLILAKRFRRRLNDGRYGTGGISPATARSPGARLRSPYPLILFGLFRLMFEQSVNTGVQWWLAAMEPWLQTFFARFGFTFKPVGHAIDYYGEVVPYAARIEDIYRTVAQMKPEVLRVILGESVSRVE